MTVYKAVVLDFDSLAPADLDLSSWWNIAEVEWQTFPSTQADQLAHRIRHADIVLTNKVVLDKTVLTDNPHIKLIIILATGTNNVDTEAAKALSIPVCNIVAYSTESVVQHTFSLMLALQTRLLDYHHAVIQGDWSRSHFFGLLDYPIDEVAGKTLGIIGFGAIGKRVKVVAEAFGMNVMVAQSLLSSTITSADRVSLEQLYQQADIVSVHSPLSPYTENLIDKPVFQQMKKTAVLINMGRGGIVNEAHLLEALNAGQIRAAALDVLTQEPPAKNHALLQAELPNLIISPHTAWASVQARQKLVHQVTQLIQALITDQPLKNQVNL